MTQLKLALTGLILLLAVLLFSCQNSNQTKDVTPKSKYTVTFDTDGGSEEASQLVAYGKIVTKPVADPYKPGYTFLGWYYTDSKGNQVKYPFSIAVTKDFTIKAKYEPITYKVIFDKNGSQKSQGKMPSLTLTFDTEYTLPQNTFTWQGKTFRGWALTSNEPVPFYGDCATVTNLTSEANNTITLYAVWYTNPYHFITYELNGGTNASSNMAKSGKFMEDQDVTIADPVRTGYTFLGWYEKEDFSGSPVIGWQAGTHLDNVTLYAKWQPDTYTVTLNDRGNLTEFNVNYDSYIPDFTAPTTVDGTFGGFYTEEYGKGVQYINASGKPNASYTLQKDLTLYALWNYSIKYINVTDGVNPNPTTYTGERDLVLADLICKDGYRFEGWLDELGDEVLKIPEGSTGTKTFTCKGITLMEYSITYEKNGGDWDSQDGGYLPPETYSKESETISLPRAGDILRAGYIFDGWYTTQDFSGEPVTLIMKGSFGDLTLYAKWKE